MESAYTTIAEVTLRLKQQYQALLGASAEYGVDKRMTKEMDTLGLLIKELEDGVVILQIRLDEERDGDTPRALAASPEAHASGAMRAS
jgi:hypothetical protein